MNGIKMATVIYSSLSPNYAYLCMSHTSRQRKCASAHGQDAGIHGKKITWEKCATPLGQANKHK